MLQTVVEQCVTGLGYELVDVEHGPGGLLRVFIDHPAAAVDGDEARIRIEDCERVSHQLSHLLTVEGIDYARLEVSSPGLDRPLKKVSDFERFVGCEASVKLKRPLQGRRNFEGVLTAEGEGRFGLQYETQPAGAKPSVKAARGRAVAAGKAAKPGKAAAQEGALHKLVFGLDEIDRARLVPRVKF